LAMPRTRGRPISDRTFSVRRSRPTARSCEQGPCGRRRPRGRFGFGSTARPRAIEGAGREGDLAQPPRGAFLACRRPAERPEPGHGRLFEFHGAAGSRWSVRSTGLCVPESSSANAAPLLNRRMSS
jgi:hypothetical protein